MKKPIRKVYYSIVYPKFSAQIEHKGKGVYIDFTGGFRGNVVGHDTNGIFITEDPELQASIEADSDFNKKFKLINESVSDPFTDNIKLNRESLARELEQQGLSPDEIAQVLHSKDQEVSKVKGAYENPDKEVEDDEPTFEEVEGINNAQQAKMWLSKNREADINMLTNNTKILEFAASVNVKFIGWPKQ